MNDNQIEQLLQRYRPAAPAPRLRDRVVTSAAAPPTVPLRAWDWGLMAAAALLILAWAAAQPATSGHTERPASIDAVRQARVELLAGTLGDEPVAFRFAEIMIPRDPPTEPLPEEAP